MPRSWKVRQHRFQALEVTPLMRTLLPVADYDVSCNVCNGAKKMRTCCEGLLAATAASRRTLFAHERGNSATHQH